MKLRSVLAVAVVLMMTLSLCGCSFGGETASSEKPASSQPKYEYIRVSDYASKGEIYGCPYALKTSPDTIKSDFHYGEEFEDGEPEEGYDDENLEGELIIDGDGTIRMVTGAAKYYYRSWLEDKGIAFLAFFDDPFSYFVGLTTKDEVLSTISEQPIYNDVADSENLFFYFGSPENIWQIKYQYGDYYLSFFFENDCLSVTTIYYEPLWLTESES